VHHGQFLARAHVVSVHRYIDDAGIDVSVPNLANKSRNSTCDFYAPRRNSREHQTFEVRISLDDLVRNPA
jgi:hypothetical protein